MKLTENRTVITTTYDIESDVYKGFKIDVVATGTMRELFLYHERCGIKEVLWGEDLGVNKSTFDEYMERVAWNVEDLIPNYIATYLNVE